MNDNRRRNAEALKLAILRDARIHGMPAGALFILSDFFGAWATIQFTVEDSVAFIRNFLASYITLDDTSLSAFMIVCAILAFLPGCRHLAAALKSLVAGTLLVAVALITGSSCGILTIEFIRSALNVSPVPFHAFIHPAMQLAVAWIGTALLLTMIFGIGNMGIVIKNPMKRTDARL